MTSRVKKAIFPVAGLGTRFLPATKASCKEMIPVLEKPLIQYVVEEAITAGIDTLIFVSGKNKRAIEDHFDSNPELEAKLLEANKLEALKKVQEIIPEHVTCVYIRQPKPLGLGHAIACAAPLIEDEPFAVLLADELICNDDGPNVLQQLCEVYKQHQCGVIAVNPVEQSEISKYGIVEGQPAGSQLHQVSRFIEKPELGQTESNLAIIGRYILTPQVMQHLKNTPPGIGGEIQLTDALMSQLQENPFIAYTYRGKRYDCGNQWGHLKATVALGLQHSEYGAPLRRYLKDALNG